MQDLRSLSRTAMRGHPEHIEFTGFRLQFIPRKMRGRNDGKESFSTFYESIPIELSTFSLFEEYMEIGLACQL